MQGRQCVQAAQHAKHVVLSVQTSLLALGPEPTVDDSVQCRADTAFRLVKMDPAQAPDMHEGLVKVHLQQLHEQHIALHGGEEVDLHQQ